MKKKIGYIVGGVCLIVFSPILIVMWLANYLCECMDEAWGNIHRKDKR